MKAIGLIEYGGPEVLHVIDAEEPHPGPGDVRIHVRAAGVNPADAMLRDGSLAEWYKDLEPPFVPGMDVAGIIDELGPDVQATHQLTVGDEVIGLVDNHGRRGGYSEYIVVPAASVTAKPAGATYAQAASFLMNALTARSALDALALPSGATLLVTGAAGAVGGYAVQLAAAEGLHVIALASGEDEDMVRSFGARDFVPRGEEIVRRVLDLAPAGVDGVVDGAVLDGEVTPAVRDGGRIATLRFWNGTPGRGITVHPVNVRERATDHEAIVRLRERAEAGELAMRVAETFPAHHAAKAHQLLDQGGLRGRLILEFSPAG
ncbi:NADP-dependent oxidoreductase [Streptomyces sp. NPDC046942]|uniref:NADP-dependent oxidoreductase n=1 Tax=Streptomyces sp. NPDC046942 TaxID=3155137 RepID=UPI0034058565